VSHLSEPKSSERPEQSPAVAPSRSVRRIGVLAWVLTGVALIVGAAIVVALAASQRRSTSGASALARNPYLDPGTTLNGQPAPNFTLRNQFGRPTSLAQFRGKVVLLSFIDSQCTTICPLTTTAMLDAKQLLGRAGARVQLLGVNANPTATSIGDVLAYTQAHAMMGRWQFLTGSVAQLRRVWRRYGIEDQIVHGLIDHTPALYVIDPQGRLRKLYMTQMAYSSVAQLGQLLAENAAALLPGHPRVAARLSYQTVPPLGPRSRVSLTRAGGGVVRLGPGAPRLYLFFDTWDREVTDLAGQLVALNRYQQLAAREHLPPLVAIDEASVEPRGALERFLAGLRAPLRYPVAIDASGRVADGYEVQDEPWLVVVSASGALSYYRDVATAGWPSASALAAAVRSALARAPKAPSSLAAALQRLAGSPPALGALHAQADRLIGNGAALERRIRALRGYPIVINFWASWCAPCRAEFALLANAAATYGTNVAFLGADLGDQPGDAQAFLRSHPVSYPSYAVSSRDPLPSLLPGGLEGTPTTIFIDRQGRLVYIHTGQYLSQGTLDADIKAHALG
jgi:cytochrome c biogenesis protein CcmG/thiol:disulfide interchange protein DsbE